jgi:phospholipase/lecithinase/hemolysin
MSIFFSDRTVMDLAQYIALKQRQQLAQTLGQIAAAEGRGYAANTQKLSRAAPDPYARLGRAAGLVMVSGMARRAAIQQATASTVSRSAQAGVTRAQVVVQRRLARERQVAIAQQKATQKAALVNATILKELKTIKKNLARKKKKKT